MNKKVPGVATFLKHILKVTQWYNLRKDPRRNPFLQHSELTNLFFNMGQPRPLFVNFRSFSCTNFIAKTVDVSGIRTRIVGVEGEHADHHHHGSTKVHFQFPEFSPLMIPHPALPASMTSLWSRLSRRL